MAVFSISTKVFFGQNASEDVHKYLKDNAIRKILFIVDKSLRYVDAFVNLVSQYEAKQYDQCSVVEFNAASEPTYDALDEFAAKLRQYGADVLIGVGGGSVLDVAKGVGILLKNPGRAVGYRGMDKVKVPGVPVVCYPATGGTGSEVTHTASFIDTQTKTKLGINGRYVTPLCAVLMPELTFSCPAMVSIGAGLDAMVHAIEAVSARSANAITAMFGAKAFALLYANFKAMLNKPDDYNYREGMLMGSYYAGIAMMNAGGGPASGISYPLGVHYGVAHGIGGGIFLPHVFRYNVSKGYNGYATVYDEIFGLATNVNDKEKSADFVDKFCKLYDEIGAPKKLSEIGYKDVDIELLTELTITQRKANLELNPVTVDENAVRDFIRQIV